MKNWQQIKLNPDLKKTYLIREQVVDGIRQFFKQQGFHEVETPLLVKSPGTEPYLEVFETQLTTNFGQKEQAFLLTSPELQMKKLLAADFGNIFQICKSFRNDEGISSRHNHEFTILEWYRVNADYTNVMADCENLFIHLLQSGIGNQKSSASGQLLVTGDKSNSEVRSQKTEVILTYQGKKYNMHTPWERISVAEAFQKFANVDTETLLDEEKLTAIAEAKGYTQIKTWEEAYNQVFLNEVEPHLGTIGPTFLYDYPASQAALSKRKTTDPRFAERFELYLGGLELGNAFTELTDAQEQKERMVADLAERKKLGKTEYKLDDDFISALESGLPPTGGIAVGVDRLVMLFADVATIQETLLFPVSELFGLDSKQ